MDHRTDQDQQEHYHGDGAIGRENKTDGESSGSWKQKQEQEAARLKHKKESERSDNVEESIRYWQVEDDISPKMKENRETLKMVLGLGETFDVVFREMTTGGRHIGYLFLNTFAKDQIMLEVLKRLTYLTPDDMTSAGLQAYFENFIPHIQVEKTDKMSVVINKVLTGMSALFMEGERFSVILDTRNYPVRSPEEPSLRESCAVHAMVLRKRCLRM